MIKKVILGIGGAILLFLLLGVYYFSNYKINEPSYGTTLFDQNGKIFYHVLSDKEEWHMYYGGEVSDKLKKAVITYEDKRFYNHCGVDFSAIIRAFAKNIVGRKRSGASTISMQLVKSLEPKKRTYLNKYREIWETFRLESIMSKDEILKLYLNNSSYGGNIRGYETASRMYFRKSSKDLSWAQAALLAVLPNAPGLMHVEKNRVALKKKRDGLLKKLMEKGYMSEEEYRFSIREQLPKRRYSPNRGGFHFANKLSKLYKGENIYSTLNFKLQEQLEELANNYERQLRLKNINNISFVVIENKTGAIRGYYGSDTYWDMPSMKRSPGSTLKPFLYALSIEEGMILPDSIYPDVPTYFGNFCPNNSDGEFHGMVKISEALKNSYNIPFVYLLKDYGDDKFYQFLEYHLGKDDFENKAGLSLILGAKEYTPLEIAYFYTALARNGRGKKLGYIEKNLESNEEKQVFEKGSAILTRRSLEKVVAPGNFERFKERNRIAWKTGTSFGRRDAWACGFDDKFTVVAWAGNINNIGNEDIRGDKTAGELMFRIFEVLESLNSRKDKEYSEYKEDEKDDDVFRKVKIDKITGYRLIPDMDTPFEEVDAPKDTRIIRESPYWKKIYVNKEGKEVDSRDEDFSQRKKVYILNYPEEVQKYYKSKNSYGKQLKILYPKENLHIYLAKDLQGQMEMLLKVTNPRGEELYWYLNGRYLGHGKEDERKISLPPGNYTLTVVSRELVVEGVGFSVDTL